VVRRDRTPFSKSDELGLADLGLRFRFAVQLACGDPLEPSLAGRVTRRAPVNYLTPSVLWLGCRGGTRRF
jgi:hypothetical protein